MRTGILSNSYRTKTLVFTLTVGLQAWNTRLLLQIDWRLAAISGRRLIGYALCCTVIDLLLGTFNFKYARNRILLRWILTVWTLLWPFCGVLLMRVLIKTHIHNWVVDERRWTRILLNLNCRLLLLLNMLLLACCQLLLGWWLLFDVGHGVVTDRLTRYLTRLRIYGRNSFICSQGARRGLSLQWFSRLRIVWRLGKDDRGFLMNS